LAGFDPTSRDVALEVAPRVVAWTELVEDLSGLEPRDEDWLSRDAAAAALYPLLTDIGLVYTPSLLANAASLVRGSDTVECPIAGRPRTQRPFPSQRKCMQWLREAWDALAPADLAAARAMIAGTGCEALFAR